MFTHPARVAVFIYGAILFEVATGTGDNSHIYPNLTAAIFVDQKIDWHGITPFYVLFRADLF